MFKKSLLFATILIVITFVWQPAQAQTSTPKSEIQKLRSEVDELKRKNEQILSKIAQQNRQLRIDVNSIKFDLANKASMPMITFFIGIFCALWAQNTNRNPWLWFFLGLFFNIITGLFLLARNADDKNNNRI